MQAPETGPLVLELHGPQGVGLHKTSSRQLLKVLTLFCYDRAPFVLCVNMFLTFTLAAMECLDHTLDHIEEN